MKKLLMLIIAFLVSVPGGIARADTVDETNFTTFESGTSAKASEVNANFTAVKDAINTNNTQFNTHSGNASAHHTRYTDAEAQSVADAQILTHKNDASAHHSKYTDAEAVAAVIAGDGSGSGIDADLLDGQEATAFAATSHTHAATDITCPSDMVSVGPVCIDKYEAFVTTTLEGSTEVTAGVGGTCDVSGSDCASGATNPIFAKSVSGNTPTEGLTWFQAQQACANVGKRLPTNAEWQMAAAGTPDTNDTVNCNVAGASAEASGTANPSCVSSWGAYDMIGNVNEWVADWIADGGAGTGDSGSNYGSDLVTSNVAAEFNGTNGASLPSAIIRGGSYATSATGAGVFFFRADTAPTTESGSGIGFRCAK